MKKIPTGLAIVLALLMALVISAQQHPRIPVVYYSHDSNGNIVGREVKLQLDPRNTYPGGGGTGGIGDGDTMIIVYPNPTPGPLTAEALNYSGTFPLRYELYSENGALLQTLNSREALTQFDLSRPWPAARWPSWAAATSPTAP